MNALERFDDKWLEHQNGCWIWVASQKGNGYGQFAYQGRPAWAHRVSWTLRRGEIPGSMYVCHTCDEKLCVNPDHMFLGTHSDNMRDMGDKGRSRFHKQTFRGSEHGMAKLNEVQAMAIFRASGMYQDISDRFGVSPSTVGQIKRKEIWRHIHA